MIQNDWISNKCFMGICDECDDPKCECQCHEVTIIFNNKTYKFKNQLEARKKGFYLG